MATPIQTGDPVADDFADEFIDRCVAGTPDFTTGAVAFLYGASYTPLAGYPFDLTQLEAAAPQTPHWFTGDPLGNYLNSLQVSVHLTEFPGGDTETFAARGFPLQFYCARLAAQTQRTLFDAFVSFTGDGPNPVTAPTNISVFIQPFTAPGEGLPGYSSWQLIRTQCRLAITQFTGGVVTGTASWESDSPKELLSGSIGADGSLVGMPSSYTDIIPLTESESGTLVGSPITHQAQTTRALYKIELFR